MKFTRILGLAAALAATSVVAQEAATVTPSPERAPAPATTLEADNTPAHWGDAAAGESKVMACAACHGADGNAMDPQYPKLAGQNERYIARQLALYKSGERQDPIMMGMAAPLTAQDMRDIGAYYATLKVVPGVADDTAVAEGPNQGRRFHDIGRRIFEAGKAGNEAPSCKACHGPSGAGNPGPAWPAVAGQHAVYTAAKLAAFRDGAVWGEGANANLIMRDVAANLTDEEIQALATYIEGLHNIADAPTAEALAAAPAPAPAAPMVPADAGDAGADAGTADAAPATPNEEPAQ